MALPLTEYARARGLRGFTGDVLVENGAMRVFEKSGLRVSKRVVVGSYEVQLLFGGEESGAD